MEHLQQAPESPGTPPKNFGEDSEDLMTGHVILKSDTRHILHHPCEGRSASHRQAKTNVPRATSDDSEETLHPIKQLGTHVAGQALLEKRPVQEGAARQGMELRRVAETKPQLLEGARENERKHHQQQHSSFPAGHQIKRTADGPPQAI